MLRITEIIEKSPYYLVCKFNNGEVKKLEIMPIIENHKHLDGVESILNVGVFYNVQIGDFGEIVWNKIVKTNQNGVETLWDYDISPEYAYHNGVN